MKFFKDSQGRILGIVAQCLSKAYGITYICVYLEDRIGRPYRLLQFSHQGSNINPIGKIEVPKRLIDYRKNYDNRYGDLLWLI
jgi:hypothetical protein